MTRRKTGNWVDRFESPDAALGRVLGHAFGVDRSDERLVEPVLTIRGMVEADASEVHVARYVHEFFDRFDVPSPAMPVVRLLGLALWHVAKVGLVRDRAERRAQELMSQLPEQTSWAVSVRASLLRDSTDQTTGDQVTD